jgi:cytochrome oxidase assembly protein ShyY1
MASAASAGAASKKIGTSGKIFFGGLCAGTFGLGVWQTVRYFEKQDMIQQRQLDLKRPPMTLSEYYNQQHASPSSSTSNKPEFFGRIRISGTFDHSKECWVGPRSPPVGALPDKPGSASHGMATAPQGYYILTPFHTTTTTTSPSNNNNNNEHPSCTSYILMINRGWVPLSQVRTGLGGGNRSLSLSSSSRPAQQQPMFPWDRPTEPQVVTVVPGRLETPRNMLKPEHNFREIPPKLYWFDKNALLAWADIPMYAEPKSNHPRSEKEEHGQESMFNATAAATDPASSCFFFTQIQEEEDDSDDTNHPSHSPPPSDMRDISSWPIRPPLERLAEFPITPSIHAAYAGTWFSLSAAGIYMTRELLRRGVK